MLKLCLVWECVSIRLYYIYSPPLYKPKQVTSELINGEYDE